MKNPCLIAVIALMLTAYSSFGQSCQDVSVELSATVESDPAVIHLRWRENASATSYLIYRKSKTASSWGSTMATLPGTATSYSDSTVSKGISYEYRVSRGADNFNGQGYINAGIEVPAIENRGRLILVVDSTYVDLLSTEIARLIKDMEGDGWTVIQYNVARDAAVTSVKAGIVDIYNDAPSKTKAVFLLGRVPVPYSGEINVDGHTEHTGAYPADVYYADMNGVWTDVAINNTSAADPRNHNVPEDGKFDQSFIPTDLELQIGRIDFANMPTFPLSEMELLRNYLDKDHAYRHKLFDVEYRAIVDDNFGYFGGEAFASSGYKNAAPLVGYENVTMGDYFSTLRDDSYLWSYGCGGGWYQGASGIGSTTDFATSSLQSVFTMLFGSYFGDWDTQDNFLRAPLAQGQTLTNVWSGRPHWQFHHMGLGENIGYDVRISQNNNSLYFMNFGGRVVHMAFMGDPTLRNHIVGPPSDITATQQGSSIQITWNFSTQDVIGYYVYVKAPSSEEYERVTVDPITTNSYTISCLAEEGIYHFMVKALLLQGSSSGTYFNLSQGIDDEIYITPVPPVLADASFIIEEDLVSFQNLSVNAEEYLWLFGDGTTSTEADPIHDYTDGEFEATLIASNECYSDTFHFTISITTAVEDVNASAFHLYPNPASGSVFIDGAIGQQASRIVLYNMAGQPVAEMKNCIFPYRIPLKDLAGGMYIVSIDQDAGTVQKLLWVR